MLPPPPEPPPPRSFSARRSAMMAAAWPAPRLATSATIGWLSPRNTAAAIPIPMTAGDASTPNVARAAPMRPPSTAPSPTSATTLPTLRPTLFIELGVASATAVPAPRAFAMKSSTHVFLTGTIAVATGGFTKSAKVSFSEEPEVERAIALPLRRLWREPILRPTLRQRRENLDKAYGDAREKAIPSEA